ncbi:hypothetical protein [Sandaracinus amylolyticus]|uniref:hypothetical protein n=1 Tax=Sandaracinus amylolyticus TaxID=927083 RepID=UPI00069D24B1|nr:hypothetical protein [Sandaracinus amylolyticus]
MKRVLVAVVVLAIAHEVLAIALDRADLIERLLSPSVDALIAIPFALALYAMRLVLFFVAPGLVVIALAASAQKPRQVSATQARSFTQR